MERLPQYDREVMKPLKTPELVRSEKINVNALSRSGVNFNFRKLDPTNLPLLNDSGYELRGKRTGYRQKSIQEIREALHTEFRDNVTVQSNLVQLYED